MANRVNLSDLATLAEHGYRVERHTDAWGKPCTTAGWALVDPDGAYLLVGDHGCTSPTEWEAVAEGLHRIGMDQH